MPRPQPANTVRKTPNFDFLFGRYSHSAVEIPYFQVNMTFADAEAYLKLVSEMPGSASMDWQIEELFQRDIDWNRVERKIVPYLTQEQQPHFFNSLTIALLPFRQDNIYSFSDSAWQPPSLENQREFAQIKPFGPIQCGYWQPWEDISDSGTRLGQMCWNTQQIAGIAIDGQHRLAAIKRVVSTGGDAYDDCTVPVIFVVLDPDLGYTGGDERHEMISTLRRLFIDLNKHAKVPSRARQILLDDRDPASICVRAVVGKKLGIGTPELDSTPPRLPLSLIDWHSEQAKFDTGPYIATVLGVDWSVAKLLQIKPLQDMMAFDQIAKLIRILETRLGIDLEGASDRLTECRSYERPFAFTDDELELMSRGFSDNWCHSLVYLLTEFYPYKEMIALRDELDTLVPEFSNWFALRERAEEARKLGQAARLLTEFEQHLMNRRDDPIPAGRFANAIEMFNEFKAERELAFMVVFQRALILAFNQLIKVKGNMVPEPDEEEPLDINQLVEQDEEDNAEVEPVDIKLVRAEQLVDALNILIDKEPSFLNRDCEFIAEEDENYDRFWIGSFVQMEGPIDFTQAAAVRASDFLLLAAIFRIYMQNEDGLNFDELMARADSASDGLDLKLYQCLGRLGKGEKSVGGRILRGRDEDVLEGRSFMEIRKRAHWIWQVFSR